MKQFLNTCLNGSGEFANFAYFFKGDKYTKYNWTNDIIEDGYPMSIEGWNLGSDFNNNIDAAFNGYGANEGKAYFFKGSQYVRYDWAKNCADEGYPLSISEWNLPGNFASGIDAAIEGTGENANKVYFFKDNEYIRYNLETDTVDEGYPLSLNEWKLIDPFLSGVDSVVNGKGTYEGKTYFFKGSQYMRYDWASDQIENGVQDIGSWRLEFNVNPVPNSIGLVTLLQKAADTAFSLLSLSLSDSRAKIHREEGVAEGTEWCGFTLANIYKQAGCDPKITSNYFGGTFGLMAYGSYYKISHDSTMGNLIQTEKSTKNTQINDNGNFVNLEDYHLQKNSKRKMILFSEIMQQSPLDILPGDIILFDHSGKNGPDHIQIVYKWIEAERILVFIDGNGGSFALESSGNKGIAIDSTKRNSDNTLLIDKFNKLSTLIGQQIVYPGPGAGRVGIGYHILKPENQISYDQTNGEHARVWAIIRPSAIDFERKEYKNL